MKRPSEGPLFSDDDVKTLKARLRLNRYSVGSQTVKDLLERLDASEAALDCAVECFHMSGQILENWRRIAGK